MTLKQIATDFGISEVFLNNRLKQAAAYLSQANLKLGGSPKGSTRS